MNNHLSNIGAIEQRKRLVLGFCLLSASFVLLVVMVQQGAEKWWRLWLFIPLWAAVLGFMQARAKT
jgi:hypothetical protein